MTRNTALMITAAATEFVLITAAVLVIRLETSSAETDPGPGIDQPISLDTSGPESADQVEQQYRQQIDEANAVLTELGDHITQLEEQNAVLREREQIYQQEIEAANQELAVAVAPDIVEQQEKLYQERLDEASTLLTETYDQSQEFQNQLQQLHDQNGALLAREQDYRQRLQESEDRLLGLSDQTALLLEREQTYGQQFQESEDRVQVLGDQNALLLEREQTYEQQLQEFSDQNTLLLEPEQIYQQQVDAANQALALSIGPDEVQQLEEAYIEQIDEASALLTQAYTQIEELNSTVQQAYDQNVILLEREQVYQQQIEEANLLLNSLQEKDAKFEFRGIVESFTETELVLEDGTTFVINDDTEIETSLRLGMNVGVVAIRSDGKLTAIVIDKP